MTFVQLDIKIYIKILNHKGMSLATFSTSIDTIYTFSSINDELVLPFELAELFPLSSIVSGCTEFPFDTGRTSIVCVDDELDNSFLL